MVLFCHKCTMVLNICLILVYYKVEMVSDKRMINWVGFIFIESLREKYFYYLEC